MTIDDLAKSLISPYTSRNPMIAKIKENFEAISSNANIDEVIDSLFRVREDINDESAWDLRRKERQMATEISLRFRRK